MDDEAYTIILIILVSLVIIVWHIGKKDPLTCQTDVIVNGSVVKLSGKCEDINEFIEKHRK